MRSESSKAKFERLLDDAWAKLVARGLATAADARARRVATADTLAGAVRGADYVQESVVEAVDVKQTILAAIDAAAPARALVGTSSSFLPRGLCALRAAAHPARVATVHPTLPSWDSFVEVLGATRDDTAWLAAFFGGVVGLDVVEMAVPNYGHALNALLASMSATANLLALRGVVAQADVDVAAVHVARLIVASNGLSGALVGVVGGGSADAAEALCADFAMSAPLAVTSGLVSAWLGDGRLARAVLSVNQALARLFDNALVRRPVTWLVKRLLRPQRAAFAAAVPASGSVESLRNTWAARMGAIERRQPAL